MIERTFILYNDIPRVSVNCSIDLNTERFKLHMPVNMPYIIRPWRDIINSLTTSAREPALDSIRTEEVINGLDLGPKK